MSALSRSALVSDRRASERAVSQLESATEWRAHQSPFVGRIVGGRPEHCESRAGRGRADGRRPARFQREQRHPAPAALHAAALDGASGALTPQSSAAAAPERGARGSVR